MSSTTKATDQVPTVTGIPAANDTEMSGDGAESGDSYISDDEETVMAIITYVGAGVAVLGVCLTMLSYIGYRKFHIKRPHIVMVNLCFCLFLYYLGYLISNPDRQSRESFESSICVFGAIVCQYAILTTWFWILVYWTLVFVMFKRPMGGHISHFFIKASVPSYGIPNIVTIVCVVVAHHNGDLVEGGYYGTLCFVDNLYLYLGTALPVAFLLIPMLAIFIILLRGITCEKEERLKSSNTRKNIKRHFIRLTIITLLFIAITSTGYIHYAEGARSFSAMIVFGVLSSILGLALMVLFCLHHEEIREHWMSVIRGEDPSMRKHSITRSMKYDVGDLTSARKSSTLKGNPPSMYIETYDEERKSSTYRIVAKEDTDMSTLGLIQIPGTPSPSRAINDANDNPSGDTKKVGRKKSDASKVKHLHKDDVKLTKQNAKSLDDIDESGIGKMGKKKSRSTSSPPHSPREKSTKRQHTTDALFGSPSSPTNGSAQQNEKKRPSKRNKNPAHRLSRLARKSTSTAEEETQLTDL